MKARTLFDDDDANTEAMTRLARRRVTIIVLHDWKGEPSLSPDRLQPVRLSGKERIPLGEARTVLLRSVSISDPDWVKFFLEQPVPSPWQRTSLLRSCRPVIFRDGEFPRERGLLRVSEALGVEIIHPGRKR